MGGGQHAQSLHTHSSLSVRVVHPSSHFSSLASLFNVTFFFFLSDTTTEQFLIPEE